MCGRVDGCDGRMRVSEDDVSRDAVQVSPVAGGGPLDRVLGPVFQVDQGAVARHQCQAQQVYRLEFFVARVRLLLLLLGK